MSTEGSAASPKDDFLTQIFSVCTTLTEEAMAAASSKVKEAGFDPNRGLVPLAESFINLSSARAILEDAIEKQKLIQLPVTVQKELLANLETIAKSLQGLAAGSDEVVNLSTAIEVLNTSIWKYGLHNLSDQVLGYQKKLNQLKNQELQITKLVDQLGDAKRAAEKASAAAADIDKQKSDALALLEQVKQNAAATAGLLDQVTTANTQAAALHASIQQNEKQSGELTSNIKTATNELASLGESIKKFYAEVDEYRRKITQTSDDASKLITGGESTLKKTTEEAGAKVDAAIASLQTSSTATVGDLTEKVTASITAAREELSKLSSTSEKEIATYRSEAEGRLATALGTLNSASTRLVSDTEQKAASIELQLNKRAEETIEVNQKRTEQLVSNLETLKGQVAQQIQQATGFALFGAFQARQNAIVDSKNFWKWAIFALVIVSAGVTAWIAYEAQSYNVKDLAFWVKLSLTVPLAFAITFCTVQYSRERRLEEEYAFKASISVSLNPYRELVHSILEKDGTLTDSAKYTDFVIESVKNVFTTPTERVFESEKKAGFTQKTFEQTAKIIGTAVKASK